MRKRRTRRKAIGSRAPILVEAKPTARWSLDFVHDQMDNGRRFRVLNIVDDVTRECLAAVPDTSISGARVVRELTALVARHSKPEMIVSDNGTELLVLAWRREDAAICCCANDRVGCCHMEFSFGLTFSPEMRQSMRTAQADFFKVFGMWRTWLALGVHDVRMRYRRTVLGPLWISLSIGATCLSMGMLFSALLKTDVRSFLPFLASGMILWNLATSVIGEGPGLFLDNHHVIKSIRMPLTIHIARCVVRNAVVFFHNIVVYALLAAVLGVRPSLEMLFIFVSLPLYLLSLHFIAMVIALLGARFRDIAPMIGMVTQFLFFLTPIIWSPDHIPDGRKYWVYANPVYHMIEIVRAPMLGHMPSNSSIIISFVFVLFTGVASYILFVSLRRRIAYWI